MRRLKNKVRPWGHSRLLVHTCMHKCWFVYQRMPTVCVCVCGVESGRCADACAYAWIVSRSTLCHRPPSDLTPSWTLPRPRSIRIVYPTPSPPSRLMHGGVKHLIMLNHSGAQHASNYPEWQHMAREMAGRGKKCHIALREWEKSRGGGGGGGVRVAEGEERTRGVECLEKKNQG